MGRPVLLHSYAVLTQEEAVAVIVTAAGSRASAEYVEDDWDYDPAGSSFLALMEVYALRLLVRLPWLEQVGQKRRE